MRSDYYVYAYLREDGTPYYVGKGTGRRLYQKNKKTHKFVKVPEDRTRIVKLADNLTDAEANQKEREIITQYGKKVNGGLLVNISDGGEARGRPKGWRHTEETKKKMSELKQGYKPWNTGVKGAGKGLGGKKCVFRGIEFNTHTEAAEYFGMERSNVSQQIRRQLKKDAETKLNNDK